MATNSYMGHDTMQVLRMPFACRCSIIRDKPRASRMVFFNHATRQMTAKIVYYGPGLCGKTTNLNTIYGKTSQKARGEMVSLNTETDRTLFFDLLPMDVGVVGGFKCKLQLYTVPGQVFYNSTRKLVLKGVDGIVFVADSQSAMLDANRESVQNLEENLRELGIDMKTLPMVFQWNKRDLKNVLPIDQMEAELNPRRIPSFQSIASDGTGVFETLRGITKLALAAIKAEHFGDGEEESASLAKATLSLPGPMAVPTPIAAKAAPPPVMASPLQPTIHPAAPAPFFQAPAPEPEPTPPQLPSASSRFEEDLIPPINPITRTQPLQLKQGITQEELPAHMMQNLMPVPPIHAAIPPPLPQAVPIPAPQASHQQTAAPAPAPPPQPSMHNTLPAVRPSHATMPNAPVHQGTSMGPKGTLPSIQLAPPKVPKVPSVASIREMTLGGAQPGSTVLRVELPQELGNEPLDIVILVSQQGRRIAEQQLKKQTPSKGMLSKFLVELRRS